MGSNKSQKKTADITTETDKTLNQILGTSVIIPNVSDVRSYLRQYPDIIDLLLPVCVVARERFGMESQLSLEVYHDPEAEDEYLTLYVRQQRYDENIMRNIKEIRSKYEEMLVGKTGWFLVTTDFRTPLE